MNKLTKLAIVVILLPALAAGTVWTIYLNMIQKRFPHIDRKVMRKAYWNMLRKSATGVYPDIQDWSDEQMDNLFLNEVNLILDPK